MSVRAVIAVVIGLLLGLGISAATYFNDFVIRQTLLIGNFLPLSVFGVLVIIIFLINPLLRIFGKGAPLRAWQLALMVAVAMAACGFPSSGFFRGFTTVNALTGHWYKSETGWQAAGAMSYLPGGYAGAAPGHLVDPSAAAASLSNALASEPGTPVGAMGQLLSPDSRFVVKRLAGLERIEVDATTDLIRVINTDLIDPTTATTAEPLWQRLVQLDSVPSAMAPGLARREAMLAMAEEAAQETAKAQAELQEWRRGEQGQRVEALEAESRSLTAEADQSQADRAAGQQPPDLESRRRTVQAELSSLTARQRALEQAVELAGHRASYYTAEALRAEQAMNRAAVVELVGDGAILPQPEGEGMLVAGGRADRFVTDVLLEGRSSDRALSLTELPWYAWWPSIRLWWPMMLAMAFMGLGMALIVHPQWSKRELLAYPIPRFVHEVSEREAGAWLPSIARSKIFWIAFLLLVGLHAINGLNEWFKLNLAIPTSLNFAPMRQLFPYLSRTWGNQAYFVPPIYASVAAFAFFLSTSVSFSLGISHLLFMMLSAVMLANGMAMQADYMGAQNSNMLRFGAYLGIFVMILYTGRRYYANVMASAVGFKRTVETPSYATWAARLMVVSFVVMVWMLIMAGVSWPLAVMFTAVVLLIMTVLSRVVCETGMFFIQPVWVPVAVMTALLGFEAVGPTEYLILALASVLLIIDPRELVAPFLSNALKIGETTGKSSPARLGPWLAVMMLAGFMVAGAATLYFQYNEGLNRADNWTRKSLPEHSFRQLTLLSAEARSLGTLTQSAAAEGLQKLELMRFDQSLYMWAGLGLALVLVTAFARLRVPWWPLHPVLFVVWGTYPISRFAFSFLLGWAIKAAVVKTTGAKGYQNTKPLMVGIIAGELFMGLVWIVVGAVYYKLTQQTPPQYQIFPG